MIKANLNKKKHLNDTLLVFFNDNPKPSLLEIKYDILNLFGPTPNSWFFYNIDNYIEEIIKFKEDYKNILLFGVSKGASASIVISNIINKKNLFNTLCWAMSPVLNIQYGCSIKEEEILLSPAWELARDDPDIKWEVDKYGNIISFIDCSFKILYSYSFSKDWMFDKKQFDLIKNKECIKEDYVECSEKMITFDKKKKPHENIHNILGYYWWIERNLFYSVLDSLLKENIK